MSFCAPALAVNLLVSFAAHAGSESVPAPALFNKPVGQTNARIPWSEIGARAGADYKGDGLSVTPGADGARLHCAFQGLDAEATREGLWLISRLTNAVNDRFQVKAAALGRPTARSLALPASGKVVVNDKSASFIRPGLVEEYTVSMDGVRQDFVVSEKPLGTGELQVRLAVNGARAEQAADGARLVLPKSGRTITYSRLRVTDANGRELPARMEVVSSADTGTSLKANAQRSTPNRDIIQRFLTPSPAGPELAVLVNDADAAYPVRIDPTFSDANWLSLGGLPGADYTVYAAVVDGLGNLYIGGNFGLVGETNANYIAKWNGSSWSALGAGMNSSVLALAVSGSDLYAGGWFTEAGGSEANYIAKWNGSSWAALGSGMDSTVQALAVSGSEVYAGGAFTTAGGSAVNRIAKWSGSSWTALGSGMNGGVSALAISGSAVYAGGGFTTAGGSAANFIAKWSESSWTALGSGMDSTVQALAVSGSDLYAGGRFETAGGSAAAHLARWNGSSWAPLGLGVPGTVGRRGFVNALAVSGSDVYAGSDFGIHKWDGSSLSFVSSPGAWWSASRDIYTLAISGSDVYVGGEFRSNDAGVADHIAKWNSISQSWSALGSGMDNVVTALAVSGSDVYAGGSFTRASGSAAGPYYIARWNGSSWSALGDGAINSSAFSPVSALAVSGSDVYVGGSFTMVGGGVVAANIAKWDGSSWSALGPLGSGMNGAVYALAVSGSDVYAGGGFTIAGGSAANNIARWDGSSWTALGSGMNGAVRALAVSGSDVYAAGEFTTAGGSEADYIAKWNGTNWANLGSGMNSYAYALAVSGSDVYAGGEFTTAGGSEADYIAKWNGSSWAALGSGMDNVVTALAVSGSDVYAGGWFRSAGGSAANYIAKWKGSSWSALGSGLNNRVRALAGSGSDLYAGGEFTAAGGKVSGYTARAVIGSSVLPPIIITTNGSLGFSNGLFGFNMSGSASQTLVVEGSTNLQNWTPLQTNVMSGAPWYFSDPECTYHPARFYRLRYAQ